MAKQGIFRVFEQHGPPANHIIEEKERQPKFEDKGDWRDESDLD